MQAPRQFLRLAVNFLITLALKESVSLDWLRLGRGKPRRRG